MLLSKKLFQDSAGYFDPTIKPLIDRWGFNSNTVHYKIVSDSELNLIKEYVGMDKLSLDDNAIIKKHPYVAVDLSSISKGYIVDVIAELLEEYDSVNYMIEIGGEIRVKTTNLDDKWVLGIKKPIYQIHQPEIFDTIELVEGALATSGDYYNYFKNEEVVYSHIFDPIEGKPVKNNIASVSVIAPTCMLADGLATTLLSMGVSRGLSLIESYENVEALFILRSDDDQFITYQSSGFEEFL